MLRFYGPLASLGLGKRNIESFDKITQCAMSFAITYAPSTYQQWFTLALNQGHCIGQHGLAGGAAFDPVYSPDKERSRVIIGFALHILRQTERDCTCINRVREYPHGIDQVTHQLLRSRDSVPITRYGTKAVISTNAGIMVLLYLLQHRIRLTTGKQIARQ
ncbi:hypothetical protein D3C72_1851650 [compost metagenome]